MHAYKKFTLILLAFLLGFFLYNAVVWKLFTEDLIADKHSVGGDLARLGYLRGAKHHRTNSYDLPRRHVEQEDYQGERIDLVTIGDSFSNGGGGGRNRYYQDYIASINDIGVMNIEPYKDLDLLTVAVVYANNGYLDKLKPRYLILSASEKFSIDRFSKPVDFNKNIPPDELATLKRVKYQAKSNEPDAGGRKNFFQFINDGNFKFLLYKIYYRYSDHAFFSKTFKKPLNAPLFSVKDSTTLLYFRDDVLNITYASQNAIERMNDNLNRLADILAKKGVKLYFMPCVDKYNLYSEFVVNNRSPHSTFFELLRPLPKRYNLIDTKALLLPEVRRGVKDVFYADDTHWSWKASEKIFDAVRFH
jgi:hypothetical protein